MSGSSLQKRLVTQAKLELRALTVSVIINSVAGSQACPRVLRWLLYRGCRIRIETMNVFSGLHFQGRLGHVQIGRGAFINSHVFLDATAEVIIGDGAQLGPQVSIITSDHPRGPGGVASRTVEGKPVRIGDNVWIGCRAIILPGVSIVDGAVIGAGAVVTSDCETPGVYVGVPARKV